MMLYLALRLHMLIHVLHEFDLQLNKVTSVSMTKNSRVHSVSVNIYSMNVD